MTRQKEYIEIIFQEIDEGQSEILIAWLSEAGYCGFEELKRRLYAYIPRETFDQKKLDELLLGPSLHYSVNTIQPENWNQLWESSFNPVLIHDKIFIRADFHAPSKEAEYDIVVTPKMSFGTGHHETTALMIEAMCDLNLKQKTVLDFGTGTGILAILAEKLGAERILAIDNDSMSVTNAAENIAMNHCSRITLEQNDTLSAIKEFDLILSNINKNVLIALVQQFADALQESGRLLVSGILENDIEEIKEAFARHFGSPAEIRRKNIWLSLTFIKERIDH